MEVMESAAADKWILIKVIAMKPTMEDAWTSATAHGGCSDITNFRYLWLLTSGREGGGEGVYLLDSLLHIKFLIT